MSVKEKLVKKINAIKNKFTKSKKSDDKFYDEFLSDMDKISVMISMLDKIDLSTEEGWAKSDEIISVVGGQISKTSNKVIAHTEKQANDLDEALVNSYNELEELNHELYSYITEAAEQFEQTINASQQTNE